MTTTIIQRQGFTPMGFSKKGFSCSSWNKCDYGEKDCAITDKDPEAAQYCNCYQRNHPTSSVKKIDELNDLFSMVDDSEMDNIFQSFHNHAYLERKKQEDEGIAERVKILTEKSLKELATMSDQEVLKEAVKRWVKMSASTNLIESSLKKGDKDKAYREFHRMINESGSSGGMISYMKIYDIIEVRTMDGRLFHPSEKELFDIYYSEWQFENEFNLFNLD